MRKKNIKILKHISIIPDGNRRWAKEKGLLEIEGHKKSATYENLVDLMNESRKLGIKYFTLWGFSTENWNRSKGEIKFLFRLMEELFFKIENELIDNKIRFRHLGRKDRLPKKIVSLMENLEDKTKNFKDFNLQICLDYGGRDEIIRAVNKLNGKKNITENDFSKLLDSKDIPDPDLVIRTSGEKRTSGFMSYQSAYSELYFTDLKFPDFGPLQLREAVEDFLKRARRFGGN